MDKKIWLNKDIKNKYICGEDTDNIYLNTNQYHIDKLFNELLSFSKDNNQFYIDYLENETKFLINKNMINNFIKFCYKNSI